MKCKYFVYKLINPIDNLVFYIGKTNDIENRLKGHINISKRSGYMRIIGLRAFGLFMVIRSFANVENKAFPMLGTIKSLTGLSINTIRKDLDHLEKQGWIRISGKRQLKGKYEANCYLILQRDYVRGSKDLSFKKKPVSRFDKGY